MDLSTDAIAVAGFVILFVLMLLRVPVGMAMGLVGVTGYAMIAGTGPALKLVGQTSMRTVTDYTFGVIPMFMLMGAFVSVSGVSKELFRAANAFFGHLRGGLGMATVLACGGFAAICGSSVATAATFSTVAYPEMRRYGYPQSFSTGVIAAGGTLGAMLPPSTVLAVYAVLTQQDIGKLFMAGVLPGLLAMLMYVLTILVIVAVAPTLLPAGEKRPWAERLSAAKDVWSSLLLFAFVIGGLYGGFFTPTEAGGMGAGGAFLLGLARRKLDRAKIRQALLQATRTAAAVFTVLIGALLFGYFLTITQTPQKLTAFLTGMGLNRYTVLALIMVMYLVLGCLMDAMAMIILTVPIIFPVIMQLGFDPIWFGVIIVMTVELGLIHPPVGMNVFVIKSVVQEVSFTTIFKGVIPFVLPAILR
ncbi:MAG: C4-dicarboxylate ABC transporter permease, partial [Burkholderiales bacterium PBB5]